MQVCFLTLHVGLGTFAPVKTETIAAHTMHEERYELSPETARAINEAKAAGRRVIAVGTTTVRVLESVAAQAVSNRAGRVIRAWSPARADPHLHLSALRFQSRRRAAHQLSPAPLDAADAGQRLCGAE